jgi:hypothetical protein
MQVLSSFNKIVAGVKRVRDVIDRADAERARREYSGSEFSAIFLSRKTSVTSVITNSQEIAHKYRVLKGCQTAWDADF